MVVANCAWLVSSDLGGDSFPSFFEFSIKHNSFFLKICHCCAFFCSFLLLCTTFCWLFFYFMCTWLLPVETIIIIIIIVMVLIIMVIQLDSNIFL